MSIIFNLTDPKGSDREYYVIATTLESGHLCVSITEGATKPSIDDEYANIYKIATFDWPIGSPTLLIEFVQSFDDAVRPGNYNLIKFECTFLCTIKLIARWHCLFLSIVSLFTNGVYNQIGGSSYYRTVQYEGRSSRGGHLVRHLGCQQDVILRSKYQYELSKFMLPPEVKDVSKYLLCPMPGTLISLSKCILN